MVLSCKKGKSQSNDFLLTTSLVIFFCNANNSCSTNNSTIRGIVLCLNKLSYNVNVYNSGGAVAIDLVLWSRTVL